MNKICITVNEKDRQAALTIANDFLKNYMKIKPHHNVKFGKYSAHRTPKNTIVVTYDLK